MRWVERFRMAMLMLFRRKSETERLNRELEFHLEQQIAENIAWHGAGTGTFCGAATFRKPNALRDEARSSWSWNWLETPAAICAMARAHCCERQASD